MTRTVERIRNAGAIVVMTVALMVGIAAWRQQFAAVPTMRAMQPGTAAQPATVVDKGDEEAITYCRRILDLGDNDPTCQQLEETRNNGTLRFTVKLVAPEAAGK